MIALRLAAALAAPALAAPFAPHPALRFERPAAEIAAHCAASKKRAEAALAQIAALPASARTFDNTPWALDRVAADLSDETASDAFLKYVSTAAEVRDAANGCETLVGQFAVETYAREDLYRALKAYAAKGERLEPESARLLEKELLDFKRSGLELPAERRERVLGLRRRIVELQASFGKNVDEAKDAALFPAESLDGLPEDYVRRLEREDGRYKVGLSYPEYFPFMENALDPQARRALETKFDDRAARENVPLMAETLRLRAEAARLLGYRTHADYVLEEQMAKDPKTVFAFLRRVRERLRPLAERELKTLAALKYVFEGEDSDGVVHAWDWRFYDNQLKKARYAVDAEKAREYFPAEFVTERLLATYQKLLGVRFEPVETPASWSPDARLFAVKDAAGGEPIAWFYMDLYPRPGKYSHAACFPLIAGRLLPDGGYQRPVAAIVANFNKPSADRPSLLSHKEVETFFHEFGHVMHNTLTKARYARFSGSSTARDFVEAPSQMLEEWVWDADVLRSLSGRYDDLTKPLPPDLLARLLAARNVDAGLTYSRQLLFGSIDMLYHTDPPKDTTAAYAKVARDVSLIPMTPGTHPEASFEHLMGGYDAGYYGYLWSKVYAEDMASVFKTEGMLNPLVGRRYRVEILEKGSSRDEMESLKAFLGRAPNEDAFLKSIGLKPGAR